MNQTITAVITAVLVLTATVGQPVAVASSADTTQDLEGTFSKAALEIGSFIGADTEKPYLKLFGKEGYPGWYIWYGNNSSSKVISWANESDDRRVLSHDAQTNRILVAAPPGDIGVSRFDRILDRGLAAESYVKYVDVSIQVSRTDPVTSLESHNLWQAPDDAWKTFRRGEFTKNGIAFGGDANKTTIGEARSAMNADTVDTTGNGVKVAVVDTGLNVAGNGSLYQGPAGFRVEQGHNFITNESIDLAASHFYSEHTTGSDFRDAPSKENYTIEGAGEDAYLYHTTRYAYLNTIEGRWNMESGSGSTAHDDINNNNGSISGSTWVTDSASGDYALNNDGTNDYVSVGEPSEVTAAHLNDSFTLIVWFKPDNPGSPNQAIAGKGSVASNTNYMISLRDDGTGTAEFRAYLDNGTNVPLESGIVPTKDAYHMATLRYNGTGASLSLNNSTLVTASASGDLASASGSPFTIGSRGGDDWFFDGTIDEVRFYNRSISDAKRGELYEDASAHLGDKKSASPETYISANHTVTEGHLEQTTAWLNVSATNVSADVLWEGYNPDTDSWEDVTTDSITASGNYTYNFDASAYHYLRVNVTSDNTSSSFSAKIFDDGAYSEETVDVPASSFEAISDGSGHGSWVASSIAADAQNNSFDGVAPQSELYIAKALNDDGSGSTEDIIQALNWAQKNDVDVISLSLGSQMYSYTLEKEINEFLENGGSAVAIAVGNSRYRTRWVTSPADTAEAIAVAATNVTSPKNAASAYFSNVGPDPGTTDLSNGRTRTAAPDVGAPGMSVTVMRYAESGDKPIKSTLSGTSMATPLVSGSVALLLEKHPKLKGDHTAIHGYMKNTSSPMPKAGVTEVGSGMVNASNLVSLTPTDSSQKTSRNDDAKGRDKANNALGGSFFNSILAIPPTTKFATA